MNRFVVMVFPDETKAYKGLHALWELHREGTVTVFGTSVVARDANGTLTVKQRADEGPLGLGIGTLTGSLVGLFGGPVGMAVGAVAGGMIGGLGDVIQGEVGNDFVQDVKRDLTPGKFAVVAEVAEDWLVPLEATIEELGGTVIRESRAAYFDTLVERDVDASKAELDQWKSERASEFAKWKAARAGEVANFKAERASEVANFKADLSGKVADRMEAALDAKVEHARAKLLRSAETARGFLDRTKEEMQAKIRTLEEQAARATPDVQDRIKHRIALVEKDLGEREQKLARAYELTQEALHP